MNENTEKKHLSNAYCSLENPAESLIMTYIFNLES